MEKAIKAIGMSDERILSEQVTKILVTSSPECHENLEMKQIITL